MSEAQARVFHVLATTPSGVTQIDFDPPNVIDGGKPIRRLAARIGELRTRFGCEIPLTAERRHKHAVYKLVDVKPVPQQAPTANPQCAIFDYEEAVA
jgi:hypothetical protein